MCEEPVKGIAGKTAFVTGGSRGIGASIAKDLALRGARVAFSFNKSQSDAELLADELLHQGLSVMAVKMEAAERTSIRTALQRTTDAWGSVDILVNNAAMAQEKPFLEIDDSDWDAMLAVNLRGPFILAQEVLPGMISRSYGRIVNISSIGGQWGGMNQVHYAAAKAGLINLTRSIAKVFSFHGITCNAVAPGLVETEMIRNELNSEAGRKKVRNIPAGRIGTCEEIASAVAFLCGADASYITGQTISINGGMYFT